MGNNRGGRKSGNPEKDPGRTARELIRAGDALRALQRAGKDTPEDHKRLDDAHRADRKARG